MSLSNVSFDSSAFPQMTFDGTNDYFDINSDNIIGGTQDFTIDAVYNNVGSAGGAIFGNYGPGYSTGLWFSGQYGIYIQGSCYAPGYPLSNGKYNMVATRESGVVRLYLNGILVNTVTLSSSIPTNINYRIGTDVNGTAEPFGGQIYSVKIYNRALSEGEVRSNYNHYRTRFNLPGIVYNYNESTRADLYTGYWNNSTTYTMADFGGISNVTAHGWSTGPATYTLTLGSLPTHTKVRYKVYWHLVDSLDNETNQLFIMNSSGTESEILRFTKQYNLVPNISIAASPGTYTWSGPKTYTYRPWGSGTYGQDGYIIVDSGWVDHTASSFTARHVMGADQGQSDEAEYLSHVEVQLFG
jgi:hypothetical protein